ncbi:hypothetical protein [Pseudorhodobacter ferrugineus]|uniref:hypothetical protein n=1 Tax=Pseudorhodobacter ferrugineus TaxID=77008 RepID=UPI0003B48FF9|nr:hypothetical protein [Pseudorhodobacter ferrugineus]
MTNLVFLALPLVIYLSLATLPKGRPAATGLAIALVFVAILRLTMPVAGPASFVALAGIAMAAIAQGLRTALGPRLPPRLYFALLGVLPLIAIALLTLTVGD